MALEGQQHNEDTGDASSARLHAYELACRLELALYVMSCRTATLRVIVMILLPLAAVTTVAFALALFFAPSMLLPLAVLAAGSAGIGAYLFFRAGRRAFAIRMWARRHVRESVQSGRCADRSFVAR